MPLFQIETRYKKHRKHYYFRAGKTTMEKLESRAINMVKRKFMEQKKANIMKLEIPRPKPTIIVRELNDITRFQEKNGIQFKCKWR